MPNIAQEKSPSSLTNTLLLGIFPSFIGILGLHRLYTKRWISGVFMVTVSTAFITCFTRLLMGMVGVSPQTTLASPESILFQILLPFEALALILFFYDVVLLISLRYKDSEKRSVLPPSYTLLSTRSFAATVFLTLNGGWFGLHRIYLGRTRTGVLMLFSGIINILLFMLGIALLLNGASILACVFLFIPLLHLIWWIEDLLHIIQIKFPDDNGLPVCRN